MDSINNGIIKTSAMVTRAMMDEAGFDKTIVAEIYSIVNVDTGEYKVKYQNNIFSVFSNDLSYKYNVGQSVYIEVPAGDFTNKKFIKNTVVDKSLGEIAASNYANSIIERSPSFDSFYKYNTSVPVGVIAGNNSYIDIIPPIAYNAGSNANAIFKQYADTYEWILVTANFKTELNEIHTHGNYGVEVGFYINSQEDNKDYDVVSYRLDCNNFNGNPYQFNNYVDQQVLIKVPTKLLLGLKYIRLFEENFEYDKIQLNSDKKEENKTIPNIFVKDVKLKYIEKEDLLNTSFYLSIRTPQGKIFTDEIDKLTLVAELLNNGKSILTKDNSVCLWFKKNSSIVEGHAKYNKYAGHGWELLDDNDFNILTLYRKDVIYKNDYMAIVVYCDDTVVRQKINITYLNTIYDVNIEQELRGTDTYLYINDKTLKGNWYVTLPDNTYHLVANNTNEINVTNYLIYSSCIFHCNIQDSIDLEYTLVSEVDKTDIDVKYIGEDSFRYDANGDVAIEDTERERTLQAKLIWNAGYAKSYRVEWWINDVLISRNANKMTVPVKSMISKIWVDNNDIVHYYIRQKFDNYSINNTLTLRITSVDEKIYNFTKEIIFMKDGDQGTNGTTYVVAIRPCDSDGNKIADFSPLLYNAGWQNYLKLKAFVYNDGELINNTQQYDITYKWNNINVVKYVSGEAANLEINTITGAVDTPPLKTNNNYPQYYTTIQVDVHNKKSGEKTSVYASYPIDILVRNTNNAYTADLSHIPSYVKYSSSGQNPSYYRDNIYFVYNNKEYDTIESLDTELLNIGQKENKNYLMPVTTFNFNEQKIGVLKCNIDSSNYILHPVMMYLNTYGHEAINGWDGTSIKTEKGYILAPQIGAGSKNSQNQFSGVIMGVDTEQNRNGLYGYENGVNTFGLMSNGNAYFGSSANGRITINSSDATIYGGQSKGAAYSMVINLHSQNMKNSDHAICVKGKNANKDSFYVSYDGQMMATAGTIGGWVIGDDELSSSNDYTILKDDGSITTETITIRNNRVNLGVIGFIEGRDSAGVTSNLGLQTVNNQSIVFASARNIALNANGSEGPQSGYIYLRGRGLGCSIPKEAQEGIYARFA